MAQGTEKMLGAQIKVHKQTSAEEKDDMYLGQTVLQFNPMAHVWECWFDCDSEDTLFGQKLNVPQLQYQFHFMGHIKEDTLVRMGGDENDASASICPEKTKISEVEQLWRLVKFPPPTWEVIKDHMSLWSQFEEMDENGDGIITEEECIRFWDKRGLKTKDIVKKLMHLFKTNKNGDKVIEFSEFKASFHKYNDIFWNDDYKIRFQRYLFVILIPLLCVFILNYDPYIKISALIGISIQFMYMVYFATLGYYFYKGSNVVKDSKEDTHYLYRVFSRPGKAIISEGRWAPLNMTINQVAWPLKCVHSISEFSAVDGAMPSVMLSNIGQYTWAMVTVHFMIKLATDPDFTWHASDICEIVGVAGLVMLGVFEADPYNASVNKFHMLGALSGFGTVLGFMLKQRETRDLAHPEQYGIRTAISFALIILAIVFHTLWNVMLSVAYFQEANAWGIYEPKEEEDEEEDSGCNCCWVVMCFVAFGCIITAAPLLMILCCAPVVMYKAARHKRAVGKRGDGYYVHHVFDFQPALSNWKEYVTPQVKQTISSFSIANVMFEGIVLMVGSTALSLWLMGYDTVCAGVCPEQVFILVFLLLLLLFGFIGIYSVFGVFANNKFGDGAWDALFNFDDLFHEHHDS